MATAFPPGVAEKIKAMGAKFDNEVNAATRALYLPLVKRQSAAQVTITADIAYGGDARQKLDLYRPEGRRLPILVYIPGGGYVGGDKNADGAFYGNLGVYFATHGYLTIVANYRLAPTHPWPAGAAGRGRRHRLGAARGREPWRRPEPRLSLRPVGGRDPRRRAISSTRSSMAARARALRPRC